PLPFDFALKSPMGKGKPRTYKTGPRTLAFRKRHFVASNAGRFILTFIVSLDTITRCYCGVQSCPRASLPPSRRRAHSTYEVSRAKFRRQNARDGKGGRQKAVGRGQ